MERFAWQSARSVAEAATLANTTVAEAMLADVEPADRCVVLKAGGIDLLDLMKEDLLRPSRVVNLREIPGLDAHRRGRCAACASARWSTLEQIAAHPVLRQRYTALADAAGSSASPQIRHVATLGGNLLQRPRCWYFRSAAHHCARKGGDHCFAFVGENQYHAVFAQYGCAIVHPSTAATALIAFDARSRTGECDGHHAQRAAGRVPGRAGNRHDAREHDLRAGEVLTAVVLPPCRGQHALGVPQAGREAVVRLVDRRCRGGAGLAPGRTLPARVDRARRRRAGALARPQAEAALTGQVDRRSGGAQAAGQAAIAGAAPLRHNAYKLPIFATLVRRAVLQAAA